MVMKAREEKFDADRPYFTFPETGTTKKGQEAKSGNEISKAALSPRLFQERLQL